jgi:hypothetical protein
LGLRERFGDLGTEAAPTPVGAARDGSRSISARVLRCSRRIATTGGMCGPTAPTALRRRSFRSSDRGRDLVFGSGLGRPGEHDDCLALSRHLQLAGDCRSHEPPRAHLRVVPPARSSLESFGIRVAGTTQHPSRVRASDAQMLTPPGVCVRGERSLHHVRGQPRKDGGKELEPPAAALRSERWVANESLRRCVAMTSETGCLRVYGPTRWTSSRGGSTGIPFVARRGCGRGDSFGRPAGATAIEHGRPFGDDSMPVAWSQTGPKHPAFPSRSGEGTPKRFGPPGETSSASWAAR